MWGIFVGIGLGLLQAVLLRKTAEWITADKKKGSAIGIPVMIGKIALILIVLYLLAKVDLKVMIWGAGGMLATMIAYPIILNIRASKKQAQETEGENIDA